MIIETLLFATALAGTAAGGISDLKTTEISDKVPLSMAIAGIILHIATYATTGSYQPIITAFAVSIGYLIIGYILYYTGQWGEADVLILAATGFVIPLPLSFFGITEAKELYPLIFLMNTFIVGGIYSLAYSFILTLKKPEVYNDFASRIKKNHKKIASMFVLVLAAMTTLTAIASLAAGAGISETLIITQFTLFAPFTIAIILLYHFAKSLDEIAFKKTIDKDKLQEGDVLAEDVTIRNTKDKNGKGEILKGKLFIGLTKEQIEAIKNEKTITHIEIKEGIRYAPTFFFAIIFTWLFGNWMTYVFGVI